MWEGGDNSGDEEEDEAIGRERGGELRSVVLSRLWGAGAARRLGLTLCLCVSTNTRKSTRLFPSIPRVVHIRYCAPPLNWPDLSATVQLASHKCHE